MNRRTLLALALTLALFIPGQLGAGLVLTAYHALAFPIFRTVIGPLMTDDWLNLLLLGYVPNFLHGLIGAALALWLTSKMVRDANYRIVGTLAAASYAAAAGARLQAGPDYPVDMFLVSASGALLTFLVAAMNPRSANRVVPEEQSRSS
jgi:hypothetical protein